VQESIDLLISWYFHYQANILVSLAIIVAYFVFRKIIHPVLKGYVERDHLNNDTLTTALLLTSLFSSLFCILLILFVWGFNFRWLLAVSTGILALTGVALFASWSLLSNITAFFVLLINKHYQEGTYIRILDADNYIEGYIKEIRLFNTVLQSKEDEIFLYPNNLLIARTVMINPKDRKRALGKTEDFNRINDDSVSERKS